MFSAIMRSRWYDRVSLVIGNTLAITILLLGIAQLRTHPWLWLVGLGCLLLTYGLTGFVLWQHNYRNNQHDQRD